MSKHIESHTNMFTRVYSEEQLHLQLRSGPDSGSGNVWLVTVSSSGDENPHPFSGCQLSIQLSTSRVQNMN